MTPDRVLRIANGQGFWGDSVDAPVRLVEQGSLDVLTLDYLAEVTMSILQKQKQRDPRRGYATDFVDLIDRILPTIRSRNIRVVANAGGVNPEACRDRLVDVARRHGAPPSLSPGSALKLNVSSTRGLPPPSRTVLLRFNSSLSAGTLPWSVQVAVNEPWSFAKLFTA